MPANTIFRRLDQQPSEEGFVSKVDAVEMMDSTDSSTEIHSSDHEVVQTERLRDQLDEVPSLVSDESEIEAEKDPTISFVGKDAASTTFLTQEPKKPEGRTTRQEEEEEKKMGEHSDIEGADEFDEDVRAEEDPNIIIPRRGRIVSLDRGQQQHRGNPLQEDVYDSPDSTSPHTDGEVFRRSTGSLDRYSHNGGRRKHHNSHEDESSSDDDSSYFASNLPSPKSGRSFSLSSTASAPTRKASYQLQKHESDASLSFSDESDDDLSNHRAQPMFQNRQPNHATGDPSRVHLSPVMHPNRAVTDMHLYAQRITRVHSVSSLVSSASSDNEDGDRGGIGHKHSTSVGSMTSSLGTSVSSGTGLYNLNMGGEGNPFFLSSSQISDGNDHHNHAMDNSSNRNYYAPSPYLHHSMLLKCPTQNAMSVNHPALSWESELLSGRNRFPSIDQQQHSLSQHRGDQVHGGAVAIMDPSPGSIPFVYSEDENFGTQACPFIITSSKQAAGGDGSGGVPMSGSVGFSEPTGGDGSQDNGSGERIEHSLSDSPGAGPISDSALASATGGGDGHGDSRAVFKVYWQRWIMLMYMSILNLLSDWTCYSVAPISLLTEEALGRIDPERLVVVFLVANAVATACEPIILARLGLRRTVLFGALLLMIGSIVKSGGLPPIIPANLKKGHAQVSLYVGFFLVGLSQPLYQCTPALLSASWFPEKERTMATGVALNANQLGIGFAFIFGTLLVAEADDIPGYFGLLSQISTIVFLGTLIQFDDAPPTPPSSSARAMRGDLKMPRFSRLESLVQNVTYNFSGSDSRIATTAEAPSPASNLAGDKKFDSHKGDRSKKSGSRRGSSTRRRLNAPRSQNTALTESGLVGSSMHYGSTKHALEHSAMVNAEIGLLLPRAEAPSPAMFGRSVSTPESELGSPSQDENTPISLGQSAPGVPPSSFMSPGPYGYAYPSYQFPYWDPRMQQYMQQQQAFYQQQYFQQQQNTAGHTSQPAQLPFYHPPPMMMPYPYQQFPANLQEFDPHYDPYGMDPYEDGAEPIVTITPHHLDIDIRDDQVIRSLHACMIRPGFCHALASFTVSGIVINTLSTFMDYLVRLNGAPRTYTGIVGGTFQFVIMISSLIIGKQTDKTRAYYSVSIAMLVLGAFGLAECGVSLDSDRGTDLRLSLVVVAALVGPLQPVSTELGVEVAYPLSENTVLVIQQLFSNLLSAIFIPFFKSLRDIGSTKFEDGELVERPQFTFSFYLLIVLHTGVTVYFATFNGKYLRYEHELQKEQAETLGNGASPEAPVHPFYTNEPESTATERQPLVQNALV